MVEAGADGRRAARTEVGVEHHVGVAQVDPRLHLLGRTTEGDHHLLEAGGTDRGQGGVEQGGAAVVEQLLGLPEPTRAPGGQHQSGDAVMQHVGAR